ncbi:unnamed protein product, partial [Pylaiella littoralis]
ERQHNNNNNSNNYLLRTAPCLCPAPFSDRRHCICAEKPSKKVFPNYFGASTPRNCPIILWAFKSSTTSRIIFPDFQQFRKLAGGKGPRQRLAGAKLAEIAGGRFQSFRSHRR